MIILTSLKDTNNPKNNCSFTERIDKTLIQDEFGLIAQQVYVEVPELRNLVVFSNDLHLREDKKYSITSSRRRTC